ncbi:MAG: ABC transporter ATP-binding protein [Clostridia bacterium]|nr:ABC transporter ATP-binding protein [Clostridia bacterium]
MQKNKTKPKYNMWQNSAWMIGLAWKLNEKKILVLCLLSVVCTVALSLVNLFIAPSILSAVERKASVSELILTILVFTGLLMFFSAANRYISANTMFGRITVRTNLMISAAIKKGTTSYPNTEDTAFEDVFFKAGMAVSDNSSAAEAIWNTLTNILVNVVGFAIYLALIASLHPVIVVSVLATSVPAFFLTRYLNGYEHRHKKEFQNTEKKLNYAVGIPAFREVAKDIRLFGLLPWINQIYTDAYKALFSLRKKAEGIYFIGRLCNLVLTVLRNGIAYFILIRAITNGNLSAAEFLLFFSATDGFASWVNGILDGFATLHKQSLEISVFREFLHYPEAFKFEDGDPIMPSDSYELKLENVSFRYPNAEDYTLKNISLTLRPGEKLAVVGLNGAGKTTLVKLMCGLYDPTEGRVLLNGTDVRTFNRREYYKLFTAVFQEFNLVPATVAQNVAQSVEDIDIPRVWDCLDKANLSEKVRALPKGIDNLLDRSIYDDAAEFSGGETQRLMLARALYKNAPFIVLDEPSAALDPIAEADMYAKYHEMTLSRSSVYISHRLASTRFCDRVIFLENGVITEEGSHDELIARGEGYAKLFEVQSRYYREEE